jgi:methylthioribose-1-phosphate isomerase
MIMNFKTIHREGKKLILLDQTALPEKLTYNTYTHYRDVIPAIKRLEVRGAPAIGIAAAYAMALAVENHVRDVDLPEMRALMHSIGKEIKNARPTAVNLFWAIDRVLNATDTYDGTSIDEYRELFWREADAILQEDVDMCEAMGRFGAELLPDKCTVLTHCNAGALATGGIGTALAVIYKAVEMGKDVKVYADETRPLLQGARLTCWELMQNDIDVTLITDNMAGYAMKLGRIDAVITGADRITKNGDVANKIGTYSVAVLAQKHNIPFYVAAPESTFDKHLESGRDIVVEERDPREVTEGFGRRTAPGGCKVFSPAFDITPHELVTAYITDTGIREGGRKKEPVSAK